MIMNGSPDGYVRVIYSNMDYYEGYMINDTYQGQGKLTFHNGSHTEGYWHNGTRFRSYEFYQSSEIFNNPPSSKNLTQDVLYNEENLGPFKFEKYIDEGLIKFDPSNEFA